MRRQTPCEFIFYVSISIPVINVITCLLPNLSVLLFQNEFRCTWEKQCQRNHVPYVTCYRYALVLKLAMIPFDLQLHKINTRLHILNTEGINGKNNSANIVVNATSLIVSEEKKYSMINL